MLNNILKNINNIIRFVVLLIILYIFDLVVLANLIILSLIISELIIKIKDKVKIEITKLEKESEK